jgi:GNAT superfamily N-acetyltransferase
MSDIAIKALKPSPKVCAVLSELLIDTVARGGSVSFMHPLSREAAEAFWSSALNAAERGERIILGAYDGDELIGTVTLLLDLPPNQPHRAEIARVLVHRHARRRGIAGRLMAAAEEVARAEGRTLLVLDAVTGGDAARLYDRLGWTTVGVIPDYALYPDGRPCATTYFYKRL